MSDRERIADLERRLAEAHSLFDRMAEGFVVCGVVRDAAGRTIDLTYIEVNPAFERQAGSNREVLIGRRVSQFHSPADLTRWMPIYARVADVGEPETFEQYTEELDRWFEVSAYPRGQDQISIFPRRDRCGKSQRSSSQNRSAAGFSAEASVMHSG